MDRPALHALLNGTAAVLLLLGLQAIRARRRGEPTADGGRPGPLADGAAPWEDPALRRHVACMLAALAVSAVFLASYVQYHLAVGSVPFWGEGPLRWLYLGILVPHTLLAVINLPLVALTLVAALRRRWSRHRAWARWTLPVWLWVSVSGVLVYLLNHALRPA